MIDLRSLNVLSTVFTHIFILRLRLEFDLLHYSKCFNLFKRFIYQFLIYLFNIFNLNNTYLILKSLLLSITLVRIVIIRSELGMAFKVQFKYFECKIFSWRSTNKKLFSFFQVLAQLDTSKIANIGDIYYIVF